MVRDSLSELDPSGASEAADVVFETVAQPVRSAALFYALLYLVDVEGVEEAAFDFKQVREKQSLGFWWYGNYAMASEFSNVRTRYVIAGTDAGDREPESLREHAEEFLFPADDELAETAFQFIRGAEQLFQQSAGRNKMSVTNTLIQARNMAEDAPIDREFHEIITDMMDKMPEGNINAKALRQNDDTGWSVGFDGPAWVGVGEHMSRRDGLSDTAWVDQSWSIEHNNNNWIDKINLEVTTEERFAVIQERFDGEAGLDDVGSFADMIRGLNSVLDAARNGPTDRLFRWAQHFQDDVGVNLRRKALELGIL